MNYTDRQGLTEDAPLTRRRIKGFNLRCSDDGGIKLTVICFTVLSIAITVALGLQLIYNDNVLQGRRHGAVATDSKDCSKIGTGVLRKGGNAVDAAVAATICMAVVNPHKTGLGGGGFAMIYSHEDREKPVIIDFATNTVQGAFAKGNVRLPALLRGLAVTHFKHGNLPWEELVLPSSKLAQEGFLVTGEFAAEVRKSPAAIQIYGQLETGQNLPLQNLSKTLDVVAKRGPDEFYNGSLSQKIFGKFTPEILQQLASYQPEIKLANVTNFYDHLVYYPPDSSALKHTLEIVNELKIPHENASSLESQERLANVLINNKMLPTDESGVEERFSSVVVMDGLDSYVVIITGLSTALGLARMSYGGFLLDSAANNLEKLTPVLFCDAVSVCGLRGIFGTDDVTLTAELFYNLMVRKINVTASIENPRYYVMQDGISIESDYPHQMRVMDPLLRASLIRMINQSDQKADQLLKSCNAIVKIKDTMDSHSDSRGDGFASRFGYSSCLNCNSKKKGL